MFERRSYERIPFHQRAKIARWPSGEPFEAWSMDLSIHGVRLATEQAVPPRQAVVVTFHLRDPRQGEVSESVRGVVVRLHCDGDGYTCGVEFDNPLDASRQPLLFKKMNFVMS